MGSFILKGITTALLVTVLTLLAGIVWGTMGLGGLSISRLVDVGLLASCLIGGYRTARESGMWLSGGVTGAGYVTVGTLLLALFLPIRGAGFIQVLIEGAVIGLAAGAVGAGTQGLGVRQGRRNNEHYSSYGGCSFDLDDPDKQFEWDTEDKIQAVKQEPIADWMDSAEGESRKNQGTKHDWENIRDVEWPWDREAPSVSKADPVEVPGGNQITVNNLRESKNEKVRPWWEE